MTHAPKCFAAVLLGLCAATTRADGLIHHLPKDGRWAKYDLKIRFGDEGKSRTATGNVRISSVGKATVKEAPCRWIELALTLESGGVQRTETYKMLIPEVQLKQGGDPLAHVVRAWRWRTGDEPKPLTDPASPHRPLSGILVGPPGRTETLKPAVIDSKLGRLKCAGVKGRKTLKNKDGKQTAVVASTTRTHAKAPFGVVTLRIDYTFRRSKTFTEKGTMTFKLADFGGNAKSELPVKKS
ncbi:MAG: hypothetical protein ACE5KM_14475 [Planctomycetaceae bacterium]